MTAVVAYAMSKPRLTRLSELYVKPPVYFFTLCTFDRKMILDHATTHSVFFRFCESATGHGIHVGRFVLMPDHIHLFVTSSLDGVDLPSWIKSLKNTLAKSWRAGAVAVPHWQKGFFDHLLRTTDSYGEKWAYVAANPVRAGLVTAAGDWPYQGIVHDLERADFRRS